MMLGFLVLWMLVTFVVTHIHAARVIVSNENQLPFVLLFMTIALFVVAAPWMVFFLVLLPNSTHPATHGIQKIGSHVVTIQDVYLLFVLMSIVSFLWSLPIMWLSHPLLLPIALVPFILSHLIGPGHVLSAFWGEACRSPIIEEYTTEIIAKEGDTDEKNGEHLGGERVTQRQEHTHHQK